MSEDFLHYLWMYKKFELSNLKTTTQQKITIQQTGVYNTQNSGPDFFNAMICIDDQKWAGTVEVHIKSSDWYVHNHENDPAYHNVILHVVWEDDTEIFRRNNTRLPTLQLKDYISDTWFTKYKDLYKNTAMQWVPCAKQIHEIPRFIMSNWQERLYVERLEEKSELIIELLKHSKNNWEAVLFKLLAKNFGLKANGEAFLSIANSFDFSILQKNSGALDTLEALLLGQANLLVEESKMIYFQKLKNEFAFLKNKYSLENIGIIPVQFFRLRPSNFPTIRLSQLAMLYTKNQQLFSHIVKATDIEDFYDLFGIETSPFWENHYTFQKESHSRKKRLTKSFIDLIIINTIIPIRFVYAKYMNKNPEEEVFTLLSQLPYEKNSIVDAFISLKMPIYNAVHSQAVLQLKNSYCDQKACLKCAIGNYLLNQE